MRDLIPADWVKETAIMFIFYFPKKITRIFYNQEGVYDSQGESGMFTIPPDWLDCWVKLTIEEEFEADVKLKEKKELGEEVYTEQTKITFKPKE